MNDDIFSGLTCQKRTTSGGESGFGARARPVDGEASATREKTRSIGYEPCRVPETTMFLTGPTNPTPATKPSLGIIRILRLFSCFSPFGCNGIYWV